MSERCYHRFTYREAVFRICCEAFEVVTEEIVRQRHLLEAYIQTHTEFRTSLKPLALHPDAPEVAQRMAFAAHRIGVGPMAAVAGAMAQCAGRAGIAAGAPEAIIDNGGDIFVHTCRTVTIGLFAGTGQLAHRLAFSLQANDTPLAICSSSGHMGHSLSLGQCDLATVVAKDAALADAAATQAANRVRTLADVNPTLECMATIDGIDGLLIVKQGRVGMAGHLPALVKLR